MQYSFYKNVACMTTQLFFAMFSNWSGESLFDSFFLFLFNTLYTALPVLIYSLFEQNYSEEELLYDPKLYRVHRRNRLMRKRQLLKWVSVGFWHSAVVFFGWYFVWPAMFTFEVDLAGFGEVIAFNSVLVISLKMLVEARHWNVFLVGSVLLSVAAYPVITILTQQWLMVGMFNNANEFRTYLHVCYHMPTFMGTLLFTVLALTPDVVIKACKPAVRDYRLMRRRRKTNPIIT